MNKIIMYMGIGVLAAFLNVSAWNMAYAGFGDNNHYNYNYEGDEYNYDNRTTNEGGQGGNADANALGVGIGVGIGKGGDANSEVNIGNGMFNKTLSPEAKATIEKGAVDVDVKNTNMNTNINSAKQDQEQGQAQLQGQLQGQKQSANNDGNHQSTSIVFEDKTDYDHISSGVQKTRSQLKDQGDANMVKALTFIDERIISITHVAAKRLGKDTKDYKVFEEMLFENDFSTAQLVKGVNGVYMGSLVLVPTGNDVTAGGLTGRAYEAAMEMGATNYVLTYTSSKYLNGSKWGIDFGTAASMALQKDGSAMLAPGSTLGYSTSWSDNEYRPSIIIELYFDDTAKITPHVKGSDGFSKVKLVK